MQTFICNIRCYESVLWDEYRSQGSIKLFKKHEISLIGNPFDFLVYFSRVWCLSWRANIRLTYRLVRLTLLDNVYMLIYYSFFAIHCFSISFDLQSEMLCFSSSSIRNLFFDCSAGVKKSKRLSRFYRFYEYLFFLIPWILTFTHVPSGKQKVSLICTKAEKVTQQHINTQTMLDYWLMLASKLQTW